MKLKTTPSALLTGVAIALGLTATPALACAPAANLECGEPQWVEGRLMRIAGINADPDHPGIDGTRIQLQSLVDDATADAVAVVICGEYRGEPVCLLAPENFNLKGN